MSAVDERRLKMFYWPWRAALNWFHSFSPKTLPDYIVFAMRDKDDPDIPSDAYVVSVDSDYAMQAFAVTIASAAFDPVPFGERIPTVGMRSNYVSYRVRQSRLMEVEVTEQEENT